MQSTVNKSHNLQSIRLLCCTWTNQKLNVDKLNPKTTGKKSAIETCDPWERWPRPREPLRSPQWRVVKDRCQLANGDFLLLAWTAVGIDAADEVVGVSGLKSEVSRAGGLGRAKDEVCGAIVKLILGYSGHLLWTGPVEYRKNRKKHIRKKTKRVFVSIFIQRYTNSCARSSFNFVRDMWHAYNGCFYTCFNFFL